MAEAVEEAVGRRRHLVVQAGTGTGKSLGYLVPAVLSGRRVVVATATKALQDQLAKKDVALVESGLRRRVELAVLKGRSNYLCRQKAAEMVEGGDQLELSPGDVPDRPPKGRTLFAEIRSLIEWSAHTPTGDRAELEFEPSARAWDLLSTTAVECPGAARCPEGDRCFAEAARRAADEADVVVVNSHLYGAHLASEGAVLPDHDVVVFDEAHELEDVFAASLGTEVGSARLRHLGRAVRGTVGQRAVEVADALSSSAERIEAALSPFVGRRVRSEDLSGGELADAVGLAVERVSRASSLVRSAQVDAGDPLAAPARTRVLLAAERLMVDLARASALSGDEVAWVDADRRPRVLRVATVDVGPVLAERLWPSVTAVLTSATIPANLGTRLGIPTDDVDRLDVGSPFPYDTNGLLYCATDLPDRRRADSDRAAAEELLQLIEIAGGRTLALFTSWRATKQAAEAVRAKTSYRVLLQSDLPKPALIEVFSKEETSCLFATMGFWQGVDVPGPSLSLVVIDRIPFPRPDEPLFMARRERAGPAAFREIDLPRAASLLAQGAGRLIRSGDDRGVVAVLDPRLARARYRWDLVRALPPMARTRHRSDVAAFFSRSDR